MSNRLVIFIAIILLIFVTYFLGYTVVTVYVENNKKAEDQITMHDNKTNYSNLIPFKMWIFPEGVNSETYFFDINSNGILEVMVGNRKSDDISDSNFLERLESKNKLLSGIEQINIKKLIEDIENDNFDLQKMFELGGWEVVILINEKKYNFNYGDYNDLSYGKLVNTLIEYSPLKVDIHGWS